MATHVKALDIARLRLAAQELCRDGDPTPVAVVDRMLCMQAQDFPASMWAVGARSGSTHADVAEMLTAGQVVRSWPMRGTLFLTKAEDLGWLLDLTATRTLQSATRRRAQLEIDEGTVVRATDTALRELATRRRLSRQELMDAFERNGISTTGQRGYHLIWHLAQERRVCWGPPHKTQQHLVAYDDWVSRPRHLAKDEALAELARRYFSGHGPATVDDLAWWSKLPKTEVKRGLAQATPELAELTCDGTTYWMHAATLEASRPLLDAARRSVCALPAFDELFLGYRDRSLVCAPEWEARVVPGKNGIFLPIVVDGGKVAGTWRREVERKRRTPVRVMPFTDVAKRVRSGFAEAIERYATFTGRSVDVEWMPPTDLT